MKKTIDQKLAKNTYLLVKQQLACIVLFSLSLVCLANLLLHKSIVVSASAEEQKQHLRIGVALEPPHLDPTAGAAAAIDEVVYANLFEGLTRIDEHGKLQPAIAESWKSTKNAKQFIFNLRKGVLFHDGKTLQAQDVVFSLTRATAPDSRNAQKRLFTNILAAEAIAPHKLLVKLREPDVNFPSKMAWGDAVIVHQDSAKTNHSKPIGTGPFRLKAWRRGANLLLEKNKNYWGKMPAIETILFRFLPEPLAAQAALRAQEVDAFPNFPAPELLEKLAKDNRFIVESGTTEGETLLAMNLQNPFFQDLRVRKAIAIAIDRKALIAGAMFNTAQPIGSHYPPHAPDYIDLTKGYSYNPKRARELLHKANWNKNNMPKLTLKLPPPSYARRSGEIIAEQLASVGFSITIRPVEWAQWLSEVFRQKKFDLTIVAHTEPNDMEIYTRENYYFGYKSPHFNKIIEKLAQANTEKERRKLRQKAQKHLHNDLPAIFLFQLPKNLVRIQSLNGLWKNSPIQANDLTKARFDP